MNSDFLLATNKQTPEIGSFCRQEIKIKINEGLSRDSGKSVQKSGKILAKEKKYEYYHIISISLITHEEQNFFCDHVTFLLEQLQNSKSWAHSFIFQGCTMFSWISQLTYPTAFILWFIWTYLPCTSIQFHIPRRREGGVLGNL